MLEPPLHTATRLDIGHWPAASGREAPAATPGEDWAAGGRPYPAFGPLLAFLLAPPGKNREAMFSAAWRGDNNDCVSTTQAHLRARTA